MALYDDLDTKHGPDKVAGWSSGLKLFQPQLQVKKVSQPTITPKAILRKPGAKILTPVVLKAKKEPGEQSLPFVASSGSGATADPQTIVKPSKAPITVTTTNATPNPISASASDDYNWDVVDEYDPMWPNEYDKLVKDRKAKEPPIKPLQSGFSRNRRDYKRSFGMRMNNNNNSSNSSSNNNSGNNAGPSHGGSGPMPDDDGPGGKKFSGFAGRPSSDDEEEFRPGQSRPSGAAIAPPPSLQEPSAGGVPSEGGSKVSQLAAYGGSSVAAKIMAKYGFKDGQGLGKQEQGMAVALQVEKTSKRGGRIVHEKDIPAGGGGGSGAGSGSGTDTVTSPPSAAQTAPEPSITEIMKSPSKVVLLRNMVGPGDVDDELEPEVKDECNTKYGDVVTVVIHEVPDVVPEEAVRIFVEFKRMESAIKAVVDLNGRFFGGRQVRAGFYNQEKFENMDLGG
ncbi:splicing factor 45 [Anopheles stephensi]|uniref:Splicing factor 45 n=1 Tax=Anopheles stephensi TaxID=30069 RepID=A0A182YPA0_ANOST|nr:splicing factor 45 [Anopheles stephensi]